MPSQDSPSSRPPLACRVVLNSNTIVGIDAAKQLPEQLTRFGSRAPLLVIDTAVARTAQVASLLADWAAHGVALTGTIESRADAEPDYDYLDAVTDGVRGLGCDAVIGVGGGSALDLAKGVGILLRNTGRGIDYRGMDRVTQPGVPVILLPTTAGSGSEVTATASFVDHASQTKLGINGRHVGCSLAILDARLTVSCPASVTSGSGLDALVHAVEAVTARTATPVSALLGAEAVRLVFRALARAVQAPDDLHARTDVLLGSHYAGLAMCNAGGGPASGISYPVGVHYRVPHGWAGGLLLPHVVAANVAKGYTHGYARLYEALDARDQALTDDAAKAAAFRDAFFGLMLEISAPDTFGQWGIVQASVARLTDLTIEQRQANLDLNPVLFDRADVTALLARVAA